MSRVYIAGRMRGLPLYNFPAFDEAEKDWQQAGWDVVNPARLDRDQDAFDPATDPAKEESFYMRRDLPEVARCDAIALLPGWRESGGTAKELAVARWCGLAVYDAETMELLPDESVLEEAARLVHSDRGAAYGPPDEDFSRTGRFWGAILGIRDVSASKVALCLIALKISREAHRHTRDNITDIAGYAETLAMIEGESQ